MSQGSPTPRPVCIGPDATLQAAWSLMRTSHVRHLPVTWSNRLVGLLSERDLLVRGALQADGSLAFGAERVSTAMTVHPVALNRAAPPAALAEAMLESGVDAIPLVDDRHAPVGLVTTTDLLKLLAQP